MVLNNGLVVHQTGIDESDYHYEYTDDIIDREIMYDSVYNNFQDMQPYDGLRFIDNIYTEINPIYVELIKLKSRNGIVEDKSVVVKDRKGVLTRLSVLPF